jgi:enoyl-CoA hydratase
MKSPPLKTLLYEEEEGIIWVTLNRPKEGNMVNAEMAREIRRLCVIIKDDPNIKVVVLKGSEDTFCAGNEDSSRPESPSEETRSAIYEQRVTDYLANIDQPVIAVINGDALGQGLEIALACDVRIASDVALMGLPQLTYGHLPWDGGTQRLPRIVGLPWATEMLLTGRIIDTIEASRINLIHESVPKSDLINRSSKIATDMASLAPIATRYVKEVISKGMDMTMDQGLRLEMDLNLLLQTTEDRSEGIASFLERRGPKYRGV